MFVLVADAGHFFPLRFCPFLSNILLRKRTILSPFSSVWLGTVGDPDQSVVGLDVVVVLACRRVLKGIFALFVNVRSLFISINND